MPKHVPIGYFCTKRRNTEEEKERRNNDRCEFLQYDDDDENNQKKQLMKVSNLIKERMRKKIKERNEKRKK